MEQRPASPEPSGSRARRGGTHAAGLALLLVTFCFHALLVRPLLEPQGKLMKYALMADQHLQGTLSPERWSDVSPLYLSLHILAEALLGSPAVILWLQIAAVSLTALLLHLLLRRFFRPLLAAAGTLVFVLDRSVVLYTHTLEPEPFLMLLAVAVAWLLLERTPARSLAAGALFTLVLLVRQNFLPLLLLVPAWNWLTIEDRKERLRASVAFAALPVAVLAAAGFAAGSLGGGPAPIFMNPGTVFFEGNNPGSIGNLAGYPPVVYKMGLEPPAGEGDYPHVAYRLIARRAAGRDLPVGKVNAYWSGKALSFIADNPWRAARLAVTRLYLFFHDLRTHDIASTHYGDRLLRASRLPAVPLALVSALACLGLVAFRRRWRSCLAVYAFPLLQLAVVTLVYMSDRQRVSVIPFMVFFACAGADALARRPRAMLPAAALALALVAAFSWRSPLVRSHEALYGRLYLMGDSIRAAALSRERGDHEGARARTAEALAITPWLSDQMRPARVPAGPGGPAADALRALDYLHLSDPLSVVSRGMLLIEAGRPAEARALLEQAADPGIPMLEPLYHLGRALEASGDLPAAAQAMEAALGRSPGNPYALAHLAVLTGREEYRGRLLRYFDDADALFLLGQAHMAAGQTREAVESFSSLVRLLPEFRLGAVYLAAALGEAGRFEEAALFYLAAMQARPEPLALEERIVPVFRHLAEAAPGDVGARYRYGVVLLEFGRFKEALQVLEPLLAAGSGDIARAVSLARQALGASGPAPGERIR